MHGTRLGARGRRDLGRHRRAPGQGPGGSAPRPRRPPPPAIGTRRPTWRRDQPLADRRRVRRPRTCPPGCRDAAREERFQTPRGSRPGRTVPAVRAQRRAHLPLPAHRYSAVRPDGIGSPQADRSGRPGKGPMKEGISSLILGPSSVPCLLPGLLVFAASLTPPLLPRGPMVQGIRGGLVPALSSRLCLFCGIASSSIWLGGRPQGGPAFRGQATVQPGRTAMHGVANRGQVPLARGRWRANDPLPTCLARKTAALELHVHVVWPTASQGPPHAWPAL
jgi:hypothetical protein